MYTYGAMQAVTVTEVSEIKALTPWGQLDIFFINTNNLVPERAYFINRNRLLMSKIKEIFTTDALKKLFPPQRTDDFFEALFGDAQDGAYDIELKFVNDDLEDKKLYFELHLIERPRKCLACNLTYGLPEVFSRHPIINIKGLVADINSLLGDIAMTKGWTLRHTRQDSSELHIIPLVVELR